MRQDEELPEFVQDVEVGVSDPTQRAGEDVLPSVSDVSREGSETEKLLEETSRGAAVVLAAATAAALGASMTGFPVDAARIDGHRFVFRVPVSSSTSRKRGAEDVGEGEESHIAWGQYLFELQQGSSVLSVEHVDLVWSVWDQLVTRYGDDLPAPQAGRTLDETMEMVWDRGPHHIEVEVSEEGRIDWFYRNRSTGETRLSSRRGAKSVSRSLLAHFDQLVAA